MNFQAQEFISMLSDFGGELISIPKNLLIFFQTNFGVNDLELIENTIHSVQKIMAKSEKILSDENIALAALPEDLSQELKINLVKAMIKRNEEKRLDKELIPVVRDFRCQRIGNDRYLIEMETENHRTGIIENVTFSVSQKQMKNIYEMDRIRQQLFHSVTSSSSSTS